MAEFIGFDIDEEYVKVAARLVNSADGQPELGLETGKTESDGKDGRDG